MNAHIKCEQYARFSTGNFFNFNGTGGVWRKKCMDDAGGWNARTLVEDMDLSLRAFLRGWQARATRCPRARAPTPPPRFHSSLPIHPFTLIFSSSLPSSLPLPTRSLLQGLRAEPCAPHTPPPPPPSTTPLPPPPLPPPSPLPSHADSVCLALRRRVSERDPLRL